MEVPARRQPGLLEERDEALTGRPRVGGRFEHDKLALLEHACQRAASRHQGTEVGLAVTGERRRDRNDHSLRLREVGVPSCAPKPIPHGRQALGGDVLDVADALLDRRDSARVDIEADHVVTGLGKRDAQRNAHVPQSDDSYRHMRISAVGPRKQIGRLD